MLTQGEKAAVWLAQHGVVRAVPPDADAGAPPARTELKDEGDDTDWANDAERWYRQRAQGVDVAQLLPYHQTTVK